MQRGLRGLDRFTITEDGPDGPVRRLEACQSPVWDTVLTMIGLADAGLPSDHPALVQAGEWVLGEEIRGPGDCRSAYLGIPPGVRCVRGRSAGAHPLQHRRPCVLPRGEALTGNHWWRGPPTSPTTRTNVAFRRCSVDALEAAGVRGDTLLTQGEALLAAAGYSLARPPRLAVDGLRPQSGQRCATRHRRVANRRRRDGWWRAGPQACQVRIHLGHYPHEDRRDEDPASFRRNSLTRGH